MIKLLEKVCHILDNQGIEYMLSGSLALNAYTLPRMTRDIDIVVKMKKEDVASFVQAIENDFYGYPPAISEEVERQGMFNLIDHETSLKVDFIVCKNTPYREKEFQRRQKTLVFGFEAWIVTIEDLIISKLVWIQTLQSEKQLMDIKSLLKKNTIDHEYLRYWANELNLSTFELL